MSETSPLISAKAALESSMPDQLVKSARELQRSLGCVKAFAYVVGILLGSGIFISPSFVAKQSNSMGIAILIWVISGIISLAGALCFCELASTFQKAGGEYIFIKEIYGDAVSFFTIWAQALVIYPAGYAFLGGTIGEYVIAPFHDTSSFTGILLTKSVAILSLVISFLINCLSINFIGSTQVIFTVIQCATVLFVSAVGVWQVGIGKTENFERMFISTKDFNARDLSLAFYDSLWAFDGWGYICVITEEIKNPSRNLPLSVWTGIPFVTLCYVLTNLAFMSALTQEEMARSPAIATAFIEKAIGKPAAVVVSFAAAVSCFSCLNASKCVSARALLSAAREGHLPEPLSYIHSSRRTPLPSLVIQLLLTILWVVAVGHELQTFLTYFSFAVWLTYGLALFGLVYIRIKRPRIPRPFKVCIGTPVTMCLVAMYLVIAPFAKQPIQSSICLIVLLSAFPVYYLFIYKQNMFPPFLTGVKNNAYAAMLRHTNLVPCIFVENKAVDDVAQENVTGIQETQPNARENKASTQM